MLQLFTMLFLLPHHRPPRNREPPFQAICVWVSTSEFLLCLTTSIIMFQVAPLNLGRSPKQSISLLPTVFFMDSQFSRHFFRLHLLCRIPLPTFSLVKRNMIVMDSADSPFIFKTSLEMVFFVQQLPWELPLPSFTCYYHIILVFYSLYFFCISMFSNRLFFHLQLIDSAYFHTSNKNMHVFVNALYFHLCFVCFFFCCLVVLDDFFMV